MPSTLHIPGFHLMRGAHAGGSVLPRHTHDDPSLCYVFGGRFTEHTAAGTYDCTTDSLKLTVAGDPHSNRFIAPTSRGLRVDIARDRFAPESSVGRMLAERVFVPRSGARATMLRVLAEMEAEDDTSALTIEGLLLELLARLARERERPAHAVPAWLAKARDLVEAEYLARLSLTAIADAVGVHTTSLARAWRRAYRTSIGEHVRGLRVARAAHELRASDTPIAEIAVRCGFTDQSHLTNVFRRVQGTTPARYRGAVTAAPRR